MNDHPNGTAVLHTALNLLKNDYWPVLIYPRGYQIGPKVAEGKEPYGKAWGVERWSAERLRQTYSDIPSMGVGICLGPGRAPGGQWLIDIEGDGPEAEESFAKLFDGECVESVGWSSVRGSHLLLVVTEAWVEAIIARFHGTEVKDKPGVFHFEELPGLELRIGGYKPDGTVKQIQSVCPPTPGTDGTPRAWNGIKTVACAPEITPAPTQKAPQAPQTNGQPVNWQIPAGGRPDDLARARGYLAKCDPAISGQNGHGQTFKVACKVGPGFDLDPEVALRLLIDEYNPRCEPPWTEKEIRHKVDDAYKVETRRGFLRDQEPTRSESRSSKANAKTDQDREPDIDDLLNVYKPKTFGVVERSIGQLQHLWPNMLILGCLSMVWSKPKIGKTRVYIGLMKILWEGLPWPDGSPNTFPKGSKVLVCPYDRNHAEIAADMRASGIPDEAAVCPYDPRDPSGISLVPLDDPLMLRIIEICLVQDPAIKLIVVDTLTYASHKSLSKPEDMKAILDGIMEVAQKHHVALWCLCHENKEGEALGRRINERARVLMRLERYSDEDPTRLRLFVKEGNFPIKPAVTVVHTDQGVTFSPDAGVPGHQADKRDDVARWLVDYLWERGVGVEVDYGTLINAAGEKGFAGKIGDDGRWTNSSVLRRAIKAINDKSESLKDLHHFWIAKREEVRPGRTQPIVFYRIQTVPS